MANILNSPTFKIEDRKAILARVQDALLASPDCRYPARGGWTRLTEDEDANWAAREIITQLHRSFPATEAAAPLLEVESAHDEPINQPTEA